MRPTERGPKMEHFIQVRGHLKDIQDITAAARANSVSRSNFIRQILIANGVIDPWVPWE